MNNFELFFLDPYEFIETANLKQLLEIANKALTDYHNNEPIMSDDEYDLLIDRIKVLSPNNPFFKKVGASVQKVLHKEKAILPYKMGSMDKIRPEHTSALENFKKKYPNNWIVSDKLDGISALLIIDKTGNKLYTRGDGSVGTDITNLLSVINIKIPRTDDKYVIRGELIMSKNNFLKYEDIMANARNMVAGIVNAKTIDVNRAKDIDFIAYEMLEPWSSYTNQFKKLEQLKINTVVHSVESNIDMDILSELLKKRKLESLYECDGIIVSYNNVISRVETASNPDYAFAFKNLADLDTAIVEVISVSWNISKDGLIKPKLVLKPTKLSGVVIKNVTAFNAKFIVDNKIGPKTLIKIVRSGDVIPYIMEVVKSTVAQMPEIEYKWNDSGVDIIVSDSDTDEQKIKELTYFCSKLEIKNLSDANITKFIESGIDSIDKILSVKKEDLAKVDNFKSKMVDKIYSNIQEAINNITLLKLMTASNVFGHGIGDKKLSKILNVHPDIIYKYIEIDENKLIDELNQIDGLDTITSSQFVKNMGSFLELVNKIPQDIQNKILLEVVNDLEIDNESKLNGLNIVFSGFRNKSWEEVIKNGGGKIATSVSKNVDILVTTQDYSMSNNKIKKAIELGIKIINKENFEKDYIK